MAARRSYGSYNDGCASAHALDLIGERWSLIVVRELILGPKRFTDLQRDVPGIGPSVLSERLRDLEAAGILVQRPLPPPASGQSYELTSWGGELEAVNAALSRWAVGSPQLPLDADMSPDTLVLAMRAHARPSPRRRHELRVRLDLSDSRATESRPVTYLATIAARGTQVVRRQVSAAVDAEVAATTRAWQACVIGGAAPDEVDDLHIDGDRRAVAALLAATRLRDG